LFCLIWLWWRLSWLVLRDDLNDKYWFLIYLFFDNAFLFFSPWYRWVHRMSRLWWMRGSRLNGKWKDLRYVRRKQRPKHSPKKAWVSSLRLWVFEQGECYLFVSLSLYQFVFFFFFANVVHHWLRKIVVSSNSEMLECY